MTTELAVTGSVDLAELEQLESDALSAIEDVTEPDEAESLLAKVKAVQEAQRLLRLGTDYQVRWARVGLRSERKYGQLLGPAKVGENRHTSSVTRCDASSGANREAARRARQVAAVPDEVFEDFIQNAKVINRSRLLRVAREAEAEKTRDEGVDEQSEHRGEVTVLHGDLREVLEGHDLTDSVVISDPPYPKEFIPLWGEMANVAYDAGCRQLVLMSGVLFLPAIIEQLETTQWNYRWTGAYLMPGPKSNVWGANVRQQWKPILVYDREGTDRTMVNRDLFESSGDDKRHHYWGQNELGFAQIVETFSEPGDLVVDPFLGGGTTAIVARDLGRRFIGCDIDAAAVADSRSRLEQS